MNISRLRSVWIVLLLCSLLVISPGGSPAPRAQATNSNVLVNGDFEEEDPVTRGFVFYPPNHYLALNWYRWWVNSWPSQPLIPEYDDMRPNTLRWPPISGKHAQVYFKWGSNYHAGVYQVVQNLTPCVPYEFSMYVNSRGNAGTLPQARIGLDPQGTQITLDHVHNDLIGGQMPPYTAWSAEQTALYTWDRLVTAVEPLGDKLTAITYANPIYTGAATPWYDTWWDNGALTQVSFPNGKLPEPASWSSPYINPVNNFISGDILNITWNTTVPASTQVWYQITPLSVPITPTIPLTETVFLPLIATAPQRQTTPLNPTPSLSHVVGISGMQALHSGDRITVWLLSRRPATDVCITEGYGPVEITIP